MTSPDPNDPPGSIRLAAASVQETGLPLLPSPNNRTPTFIGEEQITKELVFYGALKVAHFLADIDFTKPERDIISDLKDKMLDGTLSPEILIQKLLNDAPNYPSELLAHRLSNDPTSPLYNSFLAGPIVLCHKDAPSEIVNDDQGDGGVNRAYLRASPYYWVGLAPSQRPNPIVGRFTSTQIEDLDVSLDIDLGKLDTVYNKAKEVVAGLTTGGLANLVLTLTTLVDAELERSMHPGHVAVVNFGFRRNPVVFIPGVMASRLRDPELNGEAGDAVWVSAVAGLLAHVANFVPSSDATKALVNFLRERVNKLKMAIGGEPATALDTQDILRRLTLQEVIDDITTIPVIGGFVPSGPLTTLLRPLLERINKPIYQPLLLFLQSQQGYVEYITDGGQDALSLDGSPNWESLKSAPDFYIYPYDWRLDNAVAAEQLAKYVDLIATVHPDSPKVDILAHSMGGLVARRFVLEHPDRVDRFISICSPYLGATKALYAARTGDFDETAMSVLVPPERLRVIGRHMPSVHQLMPNRGLHTLGLIPLKERGWDLDGDGDTRGNLGYDGYVKAVDGEFLRLSEDMLPQPGDEDDEDDEDDRALLEAHPRPISSFNQPFHERTGTGTSSGSQQDWHTDSGDIRYIHFVCLQSAARTISTLEARPVLVPEPLQPDISLSLPPLEFFDSEERTGVDIPILPEVTQGIATDPEIAYRLTWTPEIKLGAGDVTVPFLSQARGFGSDIDFNAPGAQVYPLLNPDGMEEHDEFVSHNGVFTNPQLWAWVAKALDDAIVAEAQPKVRISADSPTEGSPAVFRATITNAPVTGAEQRVYWDMGDGTVLQGNPVSHTYTDDGRRTVSVCVSWEPGLTIEGDDADIAKRDTFAATDALQVLVLDSDPALAIEPPSGGVLPGAIASFRLNVSGAFGDDVEAFRWDFGDGTPTSTQDPENFVAEHVFTQEGSYLVTCELVDDDGSTQTVTTQVTVGLQPLAAQAAPQPNVTDPPPDPSASPQSVERLEIRVVGHKADSSSLSILHDNRLVYDGESLVGGDGSILRLVAAEPGDATRPAVEYIEIPRLKYIDDEIDLPDETIVELTGDRPQMTVRIRHIRSEAPARCYTFRFSYDEGLLPFGDTIEFKIRWDELPFVTNASVEALADYGSKFLLQDAGVDRCDDRAPSINFSRNNSDDTLHITTDDDTVPDGPAVGTDDTELAVGLAGPPLTAADLPDDPSAEPTPSELDGQMLVKALNRVATTDAPPGLQIPSDSQQNARTVEDVECLNEQHGITLAEVQEIQSSVQQTFLEVKSMELFRRFVFSFDDLWILEQGSGALLWKATNGATEEIREAALEKLQGVYVKGKSDNDYEVFLPVFKSQAGIPRFINDSGNIRPLNPEIPDDRARFAFLAATPEMMEGDWYFVRPRGEKFQNGSFLDLGPPPDPEDTEAFRRFVESADVWRYDIGRADAAENNGMTLATWNGRIAKNLPTISGQPSVFAMPATPAEVISHLLTATVKANATRRKVLPDVSFFPFRREHLTFGTLSLEKPPPFGDDPVGDAGMGRQLLLLKWLLEGAFLPPFDSFNAGVPNDLTFRTELYDRLTTNAASVLPEGYEWGLYQQWAILREASHFRVRPEGFTETNAAALRARERCRQVFGNYLDAHDDKVMKKVGKACIRALLAGLVINPSDRARVFGVDPQEFDADGELRSFEHLIARIALDNPGQFNLSEAAIRQFLGAKVGDPFTFCEIRQQPGGVDGFIRQGHRFLATVQSSTGTAYGSFFGQLINGGRIPELDARRRNAQSIEFGLAGLTGDQPGREQLLGISGQVELRYPFIVTLARNNPTKTIDGLSVVLQPGDGRPPIVCPPAGQARLSMPVGTTHLTVKHEDPSGIPVLSLFRQAGDALTGAIKRHSIAVELEGTNDSDNADPSNDTARLESEILAPAARFDSQLVPRPATRWVYRGMRLSTADFNALVSDQLSQGKLFAPYRFYRSSPGQPPITLEQARTLLLIEFEQKLAANPIDFAPFEEADFDVMSQNELLAVTHTAHGAPPPPAIGDFTPFISTAENIESAINFALDKQNDVRLLLALEVAQGQGFEYVPTARTLEGGRRVLRRMNEEEGKEIAFLDDLAFVRCHLYKVIENGANDVNGPFLLEFVNTFEGTTP